MGDLRVNISVEEYKQLAIKTAFNKELIDKVTRGSDDKILRTTLSMIVMEFMFKLEHEINRKVYDDKTI